MSKSKDCVKPELSHEDDPILDLQAAAEQLGRSPQTLRNWINQGAMQYVRMPSGAPKVRQSTINELLRPRQETVK